MTERILAAVPVPTGDAVRELLPLLRAALNGTGPALLPHAPGERPPAALRAGEPLGADEDGTDDPTVAVIATSGSTGRPKGALLPAGALLASASATHDRLGGPGRWLLALPAHHVAGLQVLVRSLVTGTAPAVLDLAGGFDPAAFAEAARRTTGPRRYTALVPTQLVRLLDAGGEPLAALAGFDGVLVGGAATPAPLAERARAAGVRLVTTYGMSETCGGCVYDGVPLDGVRVELQPVQEPRAAGSGSVAEGTGPARGGRIRLIGPMIARGYRGGDPAGAFDGTLADGSGLRGFRTDDLGRWQDGRLEVLGRLDDLVLTGGIKIAPALVEASLLRLPGVAEALAFGVSDPEWGERMVAVLVPAPGAAAPTLAEVRARVSADVAPHAAPRQLLVLDRLPLRGPGKPDRVALRALAGRS